MSFYKSILTLMVLGLGLLALGSASASASTAIRLDPGPVAFPAGGTITNTTSSSATLSLGATGTIHCGLVKGTATVASGASATSISATLTAITFSTCTDTLPVVTIESCSLAAGTTPSISILGTSSSGGTVTTTDARVRCFLGGSGGAAFCEYTAATAAGTAVNSTSTLAYSSVGVTHVNGASGDQGVLCGASGSFNVTANHMVQSGTNRTLTLTTT